MRVAAGRLRALIPHSHEAERAEAALVAAATVQARKEAEAEAKAAGIPCSHHLGHLEAAATRSSQDDDAVPSVTVEFPSHDS